MCKVKLALCIRESGQDLHHRLVPSSLVKNTYPASAFCAMDVIHAHHKPEKEMSEVCLHQRVPEIQTHMFIKMYTPVAKTTLYCLELQRKDMQ